MAHSRRDFLKTSSATMAAAALIPRISEEPLIMPATRMPSLADPNVREVAMKALEAAKSAGASYADIRINVGKVRRSDATDRKITLTRIVNELQFGVRVLADGAWGFASSREVSNGEAVRLAGMAVTQAKTGLRSRKKTLDLAPTPVVKDGAWQTPIDSDPWKKTVDDQLSLQLQAHDLILKEKKTMALSIWAFYSADQTFASTEGTYVTQKLHQFGGFMYIGVISDDREYGHYRQPEKFYTGGYGWEAIDGIPFKDDIPRLAEEARAMTRAKPVEVGRYDVVLDSAAMAAPLSDSLARAFELDRALGYEMNAGGTSYLNPPDQVLGKYDFKNARINVKGTRSAPRAAETVKWDEEGVEPHEFQLIKDGVVVDYVTSREFAAKLSWWYKQQGKEVRSNGCAGSQGPDSIQIILPPTVVLEPNSRDTSVEELCADVKDGIYFSKQGSASMDPPLMNGQFLSSMGVVREIKNGKLGDMVKYAAFLSRTPDLWKSVDMLGGKQTFDYHGVGLIKGEPPQIIGRTVGGPAARIRQVNVMSYGRRG